MIVLLFILGGACIIGIVYILIKAYKLEKERKEILKDFNEKIFK